MNGLNEMGNNEIEIEWLKKKTVSRKTIFQINKREDTSSEPTFSYMARLSR